MKNRTAYHLIVLGCTLGVGVIACATLPETKVKRHLFPRNAFVGDVQRPYMVLGPVRSKVDYASLDSAHEEKDLCKNFYNKAVRDLLSYAKKQGGDAVIDVHSVVFLADGRRETYKTPECSDDGAEGQILAQGIAVKWKSDGAGNGSWTQPQEGAEIKTRQPAAVPSRHFVPQAAKQVVKPQSTIPLPPTMPLAPAILYEPPTQVNESGYESVPMTATQPLPMAAPAVSTPPAVITPLVAPAIEPDHRPEFLPDTDGEVALPDAVERPMFRGTGFADPRSGPVIR